jgi:virginiamycin B lyase
VPGANPLPGTLVAGPDGALYLAERNDNVISRLTTSGVFTTEYTLPRENADPVDMVAGPDGALWISEHSSGVVSRMTFKGRFTNRYKIVRGFNDTLAFGRDGSLWIAQGSLGQLARLDVDRHRSTRSIARYSPMSSFQTSG